MPRLRCNIQFPQTLRGALRVESPVGTLFSEEQFESSTVIKEYSLTMYSAYVLVNVGVRATATPPGKERKLTEKIYVVVTPGVSTELKNVWKETPSVTTSYGRAVELKNKIREKVSVSVS